MTVNHTWCLAVEWHFKSILQVDIALAVDSLTQRIDDASQHIVVDANGSDTLGTLHHHTLLDA